MKTKPVAVRVVLLRKSLGGSPGNFQYTAQLQRHDAGSWKTVSQSSGSSSEEVMAKAVAESKARPPEIRILVRTEADDFWKTVWVADVQKKENNKWMYVPGVRGIEKSEAEAIQKATIAAQKKGLMP